MIKKFQALLATGRIANLPTVWSNVIVGFYLIFFLSDSVNGPSHDYGFTNSKNHIAPWLIAFTLFSASCLYVAGCMLGDYKDSQFDAIHRPNRPIPRGIISGRLVASLAAILFGLGLVIGCLATHLSLIFVFDISYEELKTIPAKEWVQAFQAHQILALALLTVLIIIYALFHKRYKPLALINMGLCRSFLYIFAMSMAALNISTETDITLAWLDLKLVIIALIVGFYTFSLSLVASTESDDRPFSQRKLLFMGMLSLPFIVVIMLKNQASFPYQGALFIGTLVVYLSWLAYSFRVLRHSKPGFVSNALAGFCLLDACIASTFSLSIALICLGLFILALLLQKVTPAT